VVRRAIAFALALALGACGVSYDGSSTCGRGRCVAGQTCISVFGDGRQNQGWNDPHYPNVTNEWWCERTCPDGMACNGQCLQDPADDQAVVCATDHVDVVYYSAGSSCLCDATNHCLAAQPVAGFDVVDHCTATHTTLASCPSNMDCPAGTFHAGDAVPGVRLYSSPMSAELLYCPGTPSNKFVGPFPEGKTLRIYADEDACP
jgi:hypothetical protein